MPLALLLHRGPYVCSNIRGYSSAAVSYADSSSSYYLNPINSTPTTTTTTLRSPPIEKVQELEHSEPRTSAINRNFPSAPYSACSRYLTIEKRPTTYVKCATFSIPSTSAGTGFRSRHQERPEMERCLGYASLPKSIDWVGRARRLSTRWPIGVKACATAVSGSESSNKSPHQTRIGEPGEGITGRVAQTEFPSGQW